MVQKMKVDIEQRHEKAQKIMRMLNSKTRDELEELNIQDRIQIVMDVKRVLTKKNIMVQLDNKCKELELHVRRFNKKFSLLQEKGHPIIRNSNGKLILLENYYVKLRLL